LSGRRGVRILGARTANPPVDRPAIPAARVKVGVFLLAGRFPGRPEAEALGAALDAGVAADAAGFDDVWVAEHHFISYGVCPSAIAFAAHLLGRTARVRVGTAVCMLANRHPVAVAEETALLDHLSGGRFELGVGRGGPWVDLEVFGTGLARYEHGFAESLDLLLAWLDRERVAADGEFFRFREVPVVPRPATRPRPPVTVACTSRATVELAARRGLPMLLGMHVGDDDKAATVQRYAAVAAAHGHDPDRVEHAAAAVCYVADSRAEAQARLRAAMPGWLRQGLAGYVPIAPGPPARRDPRAYVEHLLAIHPVGTPDQCVGRLVQSAERTGIRRVLLMVEGAGDRRRTLDNVNRLGAEVLPHLARA
jgi:alkanesulfonate monooxygenase SsuD/methylene tetrahydromethanopterin reductase-like flavin-dependent oxidoreductase (luciferase family)